MPPRSQKTPYGDVTLTSKYVRDRYYLVANGSEQSIKWLFPTKACVPERHRELFRHTFKPANEPIKVERVLRQVCAKWEDAWYNRLQDEATLTPVNESPLVKIPSTLRQAYEHHQAHYAALLGARTNEQYPALMNEWFHYIKADTPLEEMTAEIILTARAVMQQERKSSNNTINGKVATLKKILNMASLLSA